MPNSVILLVLVPLEEAWQSRFPSLVVHSGEGSEAGLPVRHGLAGTGAGA